MVALQPKREELQRIEWKPCVSGDESNFVVALNNAKIKSITVEELKQTLRLVFVKIGLRANNMPTDEEKVVLISHIINEYGNHTAQEILLAFDMAITFKLDLPEREISCYENFSCQYVSKIMNAYRRWANETYKSLKKDTPMVEEKKELTNEEWDEWLTDMKGYKMEMIPVGAYDYLLRVGKISPTVQDKKDFFELAKSKYAVMVQDNLRKWDDFVKEKATGKFSEEHYSNLVVLSKRMIVQKYLRNV